MNRRLLKHPKRSKEYLGKSNVRENAKKDFNILQGEKQNIRPGSQLDVYVGEETTLAELYAGAVTQTSREGSGLGNRRRENTFYFGLLEFQGPVSPS